MNVPDPLSPAEVDDLLREQARTRQADLLVLRDALDRMADALEQLGSAVGELRPERLRSRESPAPAASPIIPPRAD